MRFRSTWGKRANSLLFDEDAFGLKTYSAAILFFDENNWDGHDYLKEALLEAQEVYFGDDDMVSLIVPFN